VLWSMSRDVTYEAGVIRRPTIEPRGMVTSTSAGRWRALALLCSAQFMVILDGAIVNVALPSIQRDLHFSASNIQWVFTAYLLTYGGLLLLGGRVADLLGRRRLFTAGALLLGCASLLAGLSRSQGTLIGARAAMGVGAAVITPAALSIILRIFTQEHERNRALGIWGAMVGLGATFGVILGGVITQGIGWEWVFFLNVPIAVCVAVLAGRLLPESRSDGARQGFDLAGGLTITLGLVLVVFAIVRAPDHGWGSAQTLAPLAAGLGLIAAFVAVELRARTPLIRLGLFKTATVAGANSVVFLLNGALTATIFMMTLFMQRALGYSALKAGVVYLPLTGGLVVFSALAAQLVTKCGVKLVMLTGTVVLGASVVVFSQASAASTFAGTLLPGFLLAAIGAGAAMVALSIAAFAHVDESDFGAASGLFNTSGQIGGALAVAVLSTVAYSHIHGVSAAALRHGPRSVLGTAYADSFTAALVFVALGLLVTLVAVRQKDVSSWRCATPYRVSTPEQLAVATATELETVAVDVT
jgi:EmrB/QacA subfamily drug resistance transporter